MWQGNTRSQVQGGVVLEPGEDLVRNGELCYAGAFLHVLRVPPWTGLVKGQFRIMARILLNRGLEKNARLAN